MALKSKQLHRHALPLVLAVGLFSIAALAMVHASNTVAIKALTHRNLSIERSKNGLARISAHPQQTPIGLSKNAGNAARQAMVLQSASQEKTE